MSFCPIFQFNFVAILVVYKGVGCFDFLDLIISTKKGIKTFIKDRINIIKNTKE